MSSGVALTLLDHIEGDDVRLTLVKHADHRFSEPAMLALVAATLDEILAGQGGQAVSKPLDHAISKSRCNAFRKAFAPAGQTAFSFGAAALAAFVRFFFASSAWAPRFWSMNSSTSGRMWLRQDLPAKMP